MDEKAIKKLRADLRVVNIAADAGKLDLVGMTTADQINAHREILASLKRVIAEVVTEFDRVVEKGRFPDGVERIVGKRGRKANEVDDDIESMADLLKLASAE